MHILMRVSLQSQLLKAVIVFIFSSALLSTEATLPTVSERWKVEVVLFLVYLYPKVVDI